MSLNKQGAWGESCLFAACVIEAGIILSMISILQSLREAWHNLTFFFLFLLSACLKNGLQVRVAMIQTRPTAEMNVSAESSYQEEVLLGNSTWGYSYYHQNYTLIPPLSEKASTSKPAACEQVHIAIEVCSTLDSFIYLVISSWLPLPRLSLHWSVFWSPLLRSFWSWVSSHCWRTF